METGRKDTEFTADKNINITKDSLLSQTISLSPSLTKYPICKHQALCLRYLWIFHYKLKREISIQSWHCNVYITERINYGREDSLSMAHTSLVYTVYTQFKYAPLYIHHCTFSCKQGGNCYKGTTSCLLPLFMALTPWQWWVDGSLQAGLMFYQVWDSPNSGGPG